MLLVEVMYPNSKVRILHPKTEEEKSEKPFKNTAQKDYRFPKIARMAVDIFFAGRDFLYRKKSGATANSFFWATKNEEMQKRWERTAGLALKRIHYTR